MIAGPPVSGIIKPNYAPWSNYLLYFALCFFIMFFPFLVCDLYYAYNNDCSPFAPGGNLNITLGNWLKADAYIILGFIVLFLILGIIACCSPECTCVYGWWQGLHIIFILWRLSWLVVGSVMFWKFLNTVPLIADICGNALIKYMWAMLIIGFIWLFVQLALAFAYPRPIPYPVGPIMSGTSIPISTGTITATPIYRPGPVVL